MSFIEPVANHYANNSKLNLTELLSSCEKLKLTNSQITDTMISVLAPFCATTFKMKPAGENGYIAEYDYRTLELVRKDLYQFCLKGMFASDVKQARDKFEEIYAEREKEGWGIYKTLSDPSYWGAEIKDQQDIEKYFDAISKLGEAKGSRLDYSLIGKGEKNLDLRVNGDLMLMLGSTLIELNNLAEEDDLPKEIKEPVIYLATILVLNETLASNPEVFDKVTKQMAPYFCASITKDLNSIRNCDVRDLAVRLASKRIEKLNSALPDADKYPNNAQRLFHDLKLTESLKTQIRKLNDLKIKWTEEGSNYSWALIDDNGEEIFYTLYSEEGDELPAKDFEEAFGRLASDDTETILTALEYFDREIVAKKEDKTIDTFEEVATLICSNLMVAEFIKNPTEKEKVQEILLLPLVQCFKNLDSKQISKVKMQAYEDAKKLFEENGKSKEFDEKYGKYGKSEIDFVKEGKKVLQNTQKAIGSIGSKKKVGMDEREVSAIIKNAYYALRSWNVGLAGKIQQAVSSGKNKKEIEDLIANGTSKIKSDDVKAGITSIMSDFAQNLMEIKGLSESGEIYSEEEKKEIREDKGLTLPKIKAKIQAKIDGGKSFEK